MCVTCKQTLAMKNWIKKNLSGKKTLRSGEIFETKCSEIERQHTSTSMEHVNQPVVNAPKKIRLDIVVKKED